MYLPMMNERLKDWIRLFWQGALPAEKHEELYRELSENKPEFRAKMEEDFGEMQEPDLLHSQADYDRYLDQILTHTGGYIKPKRNWFHRIDKRWALAACLLIFLGFGYWTWERGMYTRQTSLELSRVQAIDSLCTLRNDSEVTLKFLLSDGSTVELDPSGKIVASNLRGEALEAKLAELLK